MIKYLTILLYLLMILANYLANALPLNNRTTGQLSELYPNLFVPAGVTFSIWGVIYLLLAGYCYIQFSPGLKDTAQSIAWLFALSCFLNGLWIFAWHYEKMLLSALIMTGLLITLILINLTIKNAPSVFMKLSFGIYLGWICIAMIANMTALLVSVEWNGAGISDEIWTILLIASGTLIVTLSLLKLNNPFIGLAAIWAFSGIIIKRQTDYRTIALTALAGALVITVIMLKTIYMLYFKK